MRRLALCIAAALLIASAGAALGTDKINGKDLNDVHDIIREVNGEDTIVPKASLLELTQVGRDYVLHGNHWTAPIDQGRGSDLTKKDVLRRSGLKDDLNYMGIAAAVSTKRIMHDGAARRVVVGDFKYAGRGGIKTFLTEPTDDGSMLPGEVRSLPVEIPSIGGFLVFTDMRGGLFIDGEHTESFVAGFMDNKTDKGRDKTFSGGDSGGETASVGFLILDGRKLNDESFTEDPAACVMADAGATDSQFPVLRIVAGDFDGDGIAQEIAYITTPKEKPYYLHIYKVSRDAKDSSKVKLEDLWFETIGNIDLGFWHGNQRDTEAGCDIVAGDFDGDGRTELAAVIISGTGSDLKPLVKTYKFVDGKFKSSSEVFDKGAHDIKDTVVPGLLAVAGDFDGDGADDVAVATTYKHAKNDCRMQMRIFEFDAVSGGAPKPVPNTYNDSYKMTYYKYTPLAKVVSLAAGPTYAAAGNVGFYDELIFSINGSPGNGPGNYQNVIFRMVGKDPVYLSSTSQSNEDAKVSALMIADLAGESMVLGAADHIISEKVRSFNTILPAVPHHMDYIRSNWRSIDPNEPDAPRALQSITPPTSKVAFSKSSAESEKNDISFETHTHFDWDVNEGKTLKAPVKEVGIKAGAEGSYKHARDDIEKKLSSEMASMSTKIDTVAQDHDIVHYVEGTLHTWRYPIIGTIADDHDLLNTMFSDEPGVGEGVPKNDPMKNAPMEHYRQKYFTVMRLTDIKTGFSGADPGDRYQPDFEERNLFSYPNALQFSKAYDTRQRELSPISSIRSDMTSQRSITFDSIRSEAGSEVKTRNNGGSLSFTGGIAVPTSKATVFSAHLDGSRSYNKTVSNGTTFTSTSKSSTGYSVTMQGDLNGPDSLFELENSAYIDAGGVTTLGFAVDLRPNSSAAHAWHDDGAYGKKPDPSFVLPGRVYLGSQIVDGQSVMVPMPQTDPIAATRLRGVRIFDSTVGEDPDAGTSYTVTTLIRDRPYTIVIPVYNASFVDTDEFTVQLGYTPTDHLKDVMSSSRRVPATSDRNISPIGEKKMSLKGWQRNSDGHRGVVSFDWIPKIVHGNVELCARIVGRDGDIHRDWDLVEGSSEYDPCGNDWGHFKVAVVEESDIRELEEKITHYVSSSGIHASAAASASEKSGPKVELTFNVEDQPPMKFDEFRRWLVGRTDPVNVEIKVENTGDMLLYEAFAMIYEQLEDGRVRTLFDGALTSIYPGNFISRSFTVDPQKFLSRDLRAEINAMNVSQTYGEPTSGGSSGSGSGCAAGAAGIAAIALLAAAARRKR